MKSTRAYPIAGLLGAGDNEDASTGQQEHVSAEEMQAAVLGATGKPDNSPITRVLKVNDQEMTVSLTPEQEIALLQKGLASDEKFREAAATRKEAETAIALQSDLEAIIVNKDVDAFRRMYASMGVSQEEGEAAIAEVFGDGSEDEGYEEDERPTKQSRKVQADNGPVGFEKLDPQTQRLLLRAEKQRIDEIIGQTLDKSEKIRYNMEQYDDEGQKAIRQLVVEKVRGRLGPKGDFGDGSHILPEVINEVETTLEALGSPRRSLSPLGLGQAPGGTDPSVYPTKKPDHVSSTEGGFEDHIEQSILYNIARSDQAKI